MSLACFSLRTPMRSRTLRRRVAAFMGVSTLAALVPLTTPLHVAALSFTGSELWGDRNPAETGTGFLAPGVPANVDTGNLVLRATDLSVGGRGRGLLVARTYNSLDAASAASPDALGWGWSFSYGRHLSVDAGSGTVTISQDNGSTVSFTPVVGGGYTAAPQVVATLTLNTDGTYTETLPDGDGETFAANGSLIAESDRNGYLTTLQYSGTQLSSVVDPAGRSLALTYDAAGRLATITDPASRTVQYGYDAAGNLATVTDVGGGVTHYAYDGAHRITSVTDAAGGVTSYAYDGAGRISTVNDPAGHGHQVLYGAGTATVVDGLGRSVQYQYSNDLLASQTRGAGSGQATTTTYTYDAQGNRIRTVDGRGGIWNATYDAHGNRTSWTDPTSRTWSEQYNGFAEPTQLTDPTGISTSYYYDATGNLTGLARPLIVPGHPTIIATTAYTYDSAHPGDLLSYTTPLYSTWQYTHDATTGDLLSATDPLGHRTSATYNGIDWQMSVTSARGNASTTPAQYTTTVTRNTFGDVLTVTEPTGGVWSTGYDAMRRVHTRTDPLGNLTTWTYDPAGELVHVSRGDGSTWTTTYDAAGEVSGRLDGLNHLTGYTYDDLGRLETVTDPLQRSTAYLYDADDNRVQTTDAARRITQYTYDGANRLTAVIDGTGLGAVTVAGYGYDVDGRLQSMTDATGTSTWSYNTLGAMVESSNGSGQTTAYEYSLDGSLVGILYPAELVANGNTNSTLASPGWVRRSYDIADRLVSVTDFSGQHVSNYTYDADNNLISATLPNLVTERLSYDSADRVLSQTVNNPQGVTLYTQTYTRNAAGLVASANATSLAGAPTEYYSYDAALRYSGATVSSATPNVRSDTYNAADAPVLVGNAAGETQIAYDDAGQPTTLAAAPTGVVTGSFSYDAMGERTQMQDDAGNSSTYAWDQAGHMLSYTGPVVGTAGSSPQQVSYTYDANGLRRSRTVLGTLNAESFAYDVAQDRPLLIEDSTMAYISGPGGFPVEQVNAAGTPLYYVTDPSGSTRLITDQAGRVVQSYSYSDTGQATPSAPSLVQPFQFQGMVADAASGLLIGGTRYYDPATAQYLSREPADTGPQRPYVAAGDDPLNAAESSLAGPPAHGLTPCLPAAPTSTTDWSDGLRAGCALGNAVAVAALSPAAGLQP